MDAEHGGEVLVVYAAQMDHSGCNKKRSAGVSKGHQHKLGCALKLLCGREAYTWPHSSWVTACA